MFAIFLTAFFGANGCLDATPSHRDVEAFCTAQVDAQSQAEANVKRDELDSNRDKPANGTRSDPASTTEPLVSETFREPYIPPGLFWHLLRAPEYAVELAFTPLALLVVATEHLALHKRIPDLLQSEDGTIRLTPDLKVSVGQGAGAGATLSAQSLTRDESKAAFGFLYRVNADRQFHGRLQRRFSLLEGREVALAGRFEVDRDREWYGLGGNTLFSDRRTVRDDTRGIDLSMDLHSRGATRLTGAVTVGFLRQRLLPGEGPRAPPVGSDADVETPPGFGGSLDLARTAIALQLSSIDSDGRPTRGGLARAEVRAAVDVDGDAFSSLHGDLKVLRYLEILPRNRVLAFKAGASAVTSIRNGDSVPFDELVSYGGNDVLRGYRKGRFRARLGWWSAVEYSFPIYDLGGLGFELAPTFFFDVGQVALAVDELPDSPLHYAGGFGLRASHDLFWALSVSLGFSPDGAQFNLELGEAFF